MNYDLQAILRLHPERVMPEDIDAALVDSDDATKDQLDTYIHWLYTVSVALRQHYRVAKYSRWSATAEDFLDASDRAEKHKNDIIKRNKERQ